MLSIPRLGFALIAAMFMTFSAAMAEDGLNTSQKKEVEALVQEYILKNPEILMRAIQEYQIRQRAAERERAKENLAKLKADFQQSPLSPVIGNPDGDVTIVEFFDYRCGYGKKVFPAIQALLKEDGNIRYMLKEYPILGPDSLVATQASLAVWNTQPEKYLDFHSALMNVRGQLSREKIFVVAHKLGLDVQTLVKAMEDIKVTGEINKNGELAESVGITGTPAFIIGNRLVPGAVSKQELEKLVSAARNG